MNYEYVNKELRIAKCNRCDVPEKFANKIEDITFFYYDKEEDTLVFISDREDCDFFIQICEMYMQLSDKNRERVRTQDLELYDRIGVTEMFIIWEAISKYRKELKVQADYKKLRSILGKSSIQPVLDHMDMLKAIDAHERPGEWSGTYTFLYGYMIGKQDERARRKKVH